MPLIKCMPGDSETRAASRKSTFDNQYPKFRGRTAKEALAYLSLLTAFMPGDRA